MAKDIIIKAEDVFFSYTDTDEYSLKGFSIEIERGKKVAFMGSNGAGKTTFFLCMNGIHKPQRGKIYIDDKKVEYSRKDLLELRRKVGIVFQDPDNQLFSASVFQEISFGILNIGVDKEKAREEVEKVIEELEIEPFKEKPVHSLSGGQKKQVSIADVLVMNPEIIIFDEPAAALDPKHTEIVNRLIEKLTERGITVLISTHDVDYAYEWADDIAVVHDGKTIAYGLPDDVFENAELLQKTNLKKPAVLEMYDKLTEKGLLKKRETAPRNLVELEKMLDTAMSQ